jgi:hypothetical protein
VGSIAAQQNLTAERDRAAAMAMSENNPKIAHIGTPKYRRQAAVERWPSAGPGRVVGHSPSAAMFSRDRAGFSTTTRAGQAPKVLGVRLAIGVTVTLESNDFRF